MYYIGNQYKDVKSNITKTKLMDRGYLEKDAKSITKIVHEWHLKYKVCL